MNRLLANGVEGRRQGVPSRRGQTAREARGLGHRPIKSVAFFLFASWAHWRDLRRIVRQWVSLYSHRWLELAGSGMAAAEQVGLASCRSHRLSRSAGIDDPLLSFAAER